MTTSTGPVSPDARTAHLVEAFKDALIRMRDGEDVTGEDLNVATDLLQLVQANPGDSLAAVVTPLFREVFQGDQDGSAPAGESAVPPTSSPEHCRCGQRYPEPKWW